MTAITEIERDPYAQFLASKSAVSHSRGIPFEESEISPRAFPFQRDIIKWALKKGRCALFTDTGTGKSGMQSIWAGIVQKHAGRVLMLAPLAVASQTIEEAARFGVVIKLAASQAHCEAPGIYITNYEKLHLFDPSKFGAVVLDESSIIKHEDSATRKALQEAFRHTEYKLCCSATPSPNDYTELGTHAEFLGVMTMQEMLATYFIHDGGDTSEWRLKGHAEAAFWRWLATWAVCIRKPSDLGYNDDGFILPPLVIHEHVIKANNEIFADGMLISTPAQTLKERQAARRNSITERVAKTTEIIRDSADAWLVWCKLNNESMEATKALSGAEVTGSQSPEEKAEKMLDFAHGKIQRLISKPSICGFGMNWQHAHNMAFVGMDDSYESFYQAVRREWRYGQEETVHVHLIISEAEVAVLANIKRKQEQAEKMMELMVSGMAEIMREEIHGTTRREEKYMTDTAYGNNFKLHMRDCVEGMRDQPDDSIDFFIYSPPFESLYTYSASDRDMGNCKDAATFAQHLMFLAKDIYRTLKPGRLMSFHCMNLPTSKQFHGYIGIRDFRGVLIRMFESVGFIFHSEVCIWKDPVTAMQRTKALGLLHKQVKKDSCMSRQGIPDYLVTMRKPGVNPEPVAGCFDDFIGDGDPVAGIEGERRSIEIWQRYASPVWMDINQSLTLQKKSAREDKDEKHICPLQLQVIDRALELWSNPGDLVCSPFMGIGSEGHEAIKMGRKFLGFELKESYFKQAMQNILRAEIEASTDLFAGVK